jgi:hypothetical protein
MEWPHSKISQSVISLILGLLAAVSEFLRFEMNSFNNFYFGAHRAYPYPYPNAHIAELATLRDCGAAFGLVFIAAFALQRMIASRKLRRD